MTTIILPAISGRRADVDRRRDRGARGNADRNALEPRDQPRGVEGGLVADRRRSRRSRRGRGSPARSRRRCPGSCADPARRRTAPANPPARPRSSEGSACAASAPGRRRSCVPPVPTPETMTSTSPSVSFQISSAVVRRWISGLAGFSNCCGMTAPGVAATSSLALAIAPFMPSAAGVSTSSAPSRASILRRSIDIDSGITRISL